MCKTRPNGSAVSAAELNPGGVPTARRGTLSKGQRPALGPPSPSPGSSAVQKPLAMPGVAAEMLSRKVFWGTSSNCN